MARHEGIRDIGRKQPRVDPKEVAKALGAEIVQFKRLSPRTQAMLKAAKRP